jgi:alpha-beta hydrolase superfamily lysophospholipase
MESTLRTYDGLSLHRRDWPLPEGSAVRGTVLLVHGLGEHIGRYDAVAQRLNAEGFSVAGYDQRGHGRSHGARGRIASADALLRDLSLVIDAARAARPGPLVLLGHSMGGSVAARYVAEGTLAQPAAWHRAVDALVLSSPALDPGMGAFQKLLLAVLGPLAPNLGVGNGLQPQWVSRDAAVVRAYVDDPLVHDRVAPRMVRFIVDAGAFVQAQAAAWRVPTLLMWAGADRCVAPAGSAAFAAAAPAALLTAREFPGLAHEIFNEPEREEVLQALCAWLPAGGR